MMLTATSRERTTTRNIRVLAASSVVIVVLSEFLQLPLGARGDGGPTTSSATPTITATAPGFPSTVGTGQPTPQLPGTSFAKEGDFYLGGLFDVHSEEDGVCTGVINPRGLQWMYAMVYAVDLINSRDDLLPNVTLGEDS